MTEIVVYLIQKNSLDVVKYFHLLDKSHMIRKQIFRMNVVNEYIPEGNKHRTLHTNTSVLFFQAIERKWPLKNQGSKIPEIY